MAGEKEKAKEIYEKAKRGEISKEEAIHQLKKIKAQLYLGGVPGVGRGRLNRFIDRLIEELEE